MYLGNVKEWTGERVSGKLAGSKRKEERGKRKEERLKWPEMEYLWSVNFVYVRYERKAKCIVYTQ